MPFRFPESLAGYTIRRFIPGEERAWWHLLDDAGGLGTWDETRAEEAFADPSGRVWKESIHFAVAEDHLVGTACVQLNDPGVRRLRAPRSRPLN
jgi:hypothetical protein